MEEEFVEVMEYWKSGRASKVPEIYLDEILLIAWEDFKNFSTKGVIKNANE